MLVLQNYLLRSKGLREKHSSRVPGRGRQASSVKLSQRPGCTGACSSQSTSTAHASLISDVRQASEAPGAPPAAGSAPVAASKGEQEALRIKPAQRTHTERHTGPSGSSWFVPRLLSILSRGCSRRSRRVGPTEAESVAL